MEKQMATEKRIQTTWGIIWATRSLLTAAALLPFCFPSQFESTHGLWRLRLFEVGYAMTFLLAIGSWCMRPGSGEYPHENTNANGR
jgi:hypothetical protein